MSGNQDNSTPADRALFDQLVCGGGATAGLPAAAAVVANCQINAPETTAYLIGLQTPASYAQCAALLQLRWNSGRAAL